MGKKQIFKILLILCILALTFPISDCINNEIQYYAPIQRSSSDEYKTFTTSEESLVHFSFEYPSDYWLNDQSQGNVNPSLYVGLTGVTIDDLSQGIVKDIDIRITNYSPKWLGLPDAESAVKEQINEYKWSFYRNYRLLEKHKAVIDGVEGWEIVVTFRERPLPDFGYGKLREPISVVARDLFFDYQGITWQISLYTDVESYEKDTKAVFEHILQTFDFGG